MNGARRKNWKRILLLAGLFILVFSCSITSQAASQKTKAKKAYRTMLAKKYIYKDGWRMTTKNCDFALAYIDNDSVPELLVYNSDDIPHMGGYGMLYTYSKGKVKYVTGLAMDERKTLGYYKQKGILTDAYAQQGYKSEYYIRLKSGKTTSVLCKEYKYNFRSDKWKLSSYKKLSSGKLKSASKSSFNKSLKSYVKTRKFTKFKFYKNTSKNRTKYLK